LLKASGFAVSVVGFASGLIGLITAFFKGTDLAIVISAIILEICLVSAGAVLLLTKPRVSRHMLLVGTCCLILGLAPISLLFAISGTRTYICDSLRGRCVRIWITHESWSGPQDLGLFSLDEGNAVLHMAVLHRGENPGQMIWSTKSQAIAEFRVRASRQVEIVSLAVNLFGYAGVPEALDISDALATQSYPIDYCARIYPSGGSAAQFQAKRIGEPGDSESILTVGPDDMGWIRVLVLSTMPGRYDISGLTATFECQERLVVREIPLPLSVAFFEWEAEERHSP